MRILIAPDSFKGTYTAAQVAENIRAGIEAGKIISAILRRAQNLPVYAVVGSVGDYSGDDFAAVLVASDAAAMRNAGTEIASLTRQLVRR